MINTFEDLFEKMRLAGHDPHRLMAMHEEHRHWKAQFEQHHGTNNLTAYVRLQMCRENLLGYLACLQDTAYICQSEYDRLWSSLDLTEKAQYEQ